MPDELWTEVHDILQETRIKTIPKKKRCKKAKWLSQEALQIAVRRREVKSKGEKERYTHLNAEFQRIAKRDRKAFLSDQCKEIEENNRMGKTRDLFKKVRDTKGTFHAKMGSIKDRTHMDLKTEGNGNPLQRSHTASLLKSLTLFGTKDKEIPTCKLNIQEVPKFIARTHLYLVIYVKHNTLQNSFM